jgi:hypothetical protein
MKNTMKGPREKDYSAAPDSRAAAARLRMNAPGYSQTFRKCSTPDLVTVGSAVLPRHKPHRPRPNVVDIFGIGLRSMTWGRTR